jgi:hypothetical protein
MIIAKGYDSDIANEIAIECFNIMEMVDNSISVEWFIDKIKEYNGQPILIHTMFNEFIGLPILNLK